MTVDDAIEINGTCDERFSRVAEAFRRNFTERDDHGASVCVIVEGETVVDLWAGWADIPKTTPWAEDTIVNVWSSTKGVAAIAAHVAADRGDLDLDAPVARYWPEFAAAGKGHIPVAWLLTHQVGLVDFDGAHPDGIALDWDEVCARLAATAPQWEPGTHSGYHNTTFGWLVGEVVRRATGATSFGQYVREVVALPCDADFWIGLPDSEHGRVARVFRERLPGLQPEPPAESEGNELARRSPLLGLQQYSASPASPEWKRAEMPAMNGHGHARALARIYSPMANGGSVNGVRLMAPEAVRRAAETRVSGTDFLSGAPIARSLGFQKPSEPDDPRPAESFGHGGMGGSLGFADPVNHVAFGYAMNMMVMSDARPDRRADDLAAAVYESLAAS